MKVFRLYLIEHRSQFLMVTLFAALLFVSFSLYDLPINAVLYPVCLCIFVGCIFIAYDFLKVKSKYELLVSLEDEAALLVADLPQVKGAYEDQYQKLIALLRDYIIRSDNLKEAKYHEMMDYYTMWVHQIKTPISSMDLALQNEDSPLSRKCAEDLFRIEQYVNMVLAYLRLDSTSSDYSFKRCQLDQIIRESVKGFSTEFINRKIGLKYEPIDYELVTDSKWLGFVLDQLLSNALKYTKEGHIAISMEKPHVLTVADTGIGISAEDLPRIFENGFTGYNGRSYKKSTGIGLYLCSRVCANLGINISASSTPGKGTTIILDLTNAKRKFE